MIDERGIRGAHIQGDSQLVVMQVRGEWACHAGGLHPLLQQAGDLAAKTRATLGWVSRDKNTVADAMSALGLKDQGVERLDLSAYTTRLGDLVPGITGVTAGKKLKAAGYRDAKGDPSERAEEEGIGVRLFYHGFWTTFWHKEKCSAVLNQSSEV